MEYSIIMVALQCMGIFFVVNRKTTHLLHYTYTPEIVQSILKLSFVDYTTREYMCSIAFI